MPIINASCLLTSVFPTPVGPENKNEPTGLPSVRNPALANLIVEAKLSIASFWPKITLLRFSSSFSREILSEEDGNQCFRPRG